MSKSWKYVLNNWTSDDRLFFERLECTRHTFGEEEGENGTPHLQGFIVFKRTYRLSALKKLHNKVHWEIARCNDHNYELKGCNVFIVDNRKQGKRSDLDEIGERIKKGVSLQEIAKDYPGQYIRYWRGLHEFQKAVKPIFEKPKYTLKSCILRTGWDELEFDNKCEILMGPSGIGKTAFALAHFKKPLFINQIEQLKNYQSDVHDGIVFDDVEFNHWPVTAQIHITDWEYGRDISCKYYNGHIPAYTKKIFTCNNGRYPFSSDPAIDRRVHVTKVC